MGLIYRSILLKIFWSPDKKSINASKVHRLTLKLVVLVLIDRPPLFGNSETSVMLFREINFRLLPILVAKLTRIYLSAIFSPLISLFII